MTPRHAAALALVGWYLMTPPLPSKENWKRVVPPAPLGRWTIDDSFDSADACKKALNDLRTRSMNDNDDEYHRWLASRTPSRDLLEKWASKYSFASAINDANGRARCIATDDPRLKSTATVSWYLMKPPAHPVGNGMVEWDASLPLGKWTVMEGFDSHEECDSDRLGWLDSAKNVTEKRFFDSIVCTATDDPRLKVK